MRALLENRRVLALLVAAAALAGESARAQAPARPANQPTSDAPAPRAPVGTKGGAKAAAAGAAGTGAGRAPAAVAQAAGPRPEQPPVAPFQLSPAEQQLLDDVLKHWEERNSKIKTFKCDFQRWEYDNSLEADLNNALAEYAKAQADAKADPVRTAALAQQVNTLQQVKANYFLRSEASGTIKYKPPDQGMFKVTKLEELDLNRKRDAKDPLLTEVKENLENWVCDGKAIHEYKPDPEKGTGEHLIHVIPKEMQGEAIADGPVPFIFGAKVDKLKARYWLREATPKKQQGTHVWLEVYPKFQHDAANFRHVKVVLSSSDYSLYALFIELPSGKQETAFKFNKIKINDFFGGIKGDFDPPKTPNGWKKVYDPPLDAPPTAQKPEDPSSGKREATKRGPAPPLR